MDTFSALADPNRRRIIELLAGQGELPSTEISAHFSISAPAISQHLKILREAKLVLMEKRAQQRVYRLNPQAMLEVEGWLGQLRQLWDRRFDALAEVIEEEKKKQGSNT